MSLSGTDLTLLPDALMEPREAVALSHLWSDKVNKRHVTRDFDLLDTRKKASLSGTGFALLAGT
jgi:hypothetical protein